MTIGSGSFTSHTTFEHEIKANGLKNNDGRNNFHDGKLLVNNTLLNSNLQLYFESYPQVFQKDYSHLAR